MKTRPAEALSVIAAFALVVVVLLSTASSATAQAVEYEKLPGGTNAQIAQSVLYVAVNEGPNGTGERLYYYFTLDELKDRYGVETRDFDYTNHTVGTTTSAHGFSITKLIDSLVDWYGDPLPVDDAWSIQYLEDDAYHATGLAYIDTIDAARDTTKPMLTFEIKETYTTPTKYNVNDAVYEWAENLYPEYLRVYRQTDSANSSVMKMMMGIAVSPDGNAYNPDTAGKYALTGVDPLGNPIVLDSKGKPGRTVLGALAGMKYGVHAPTVAAYTPTEQSQIITVDPAATSTQAVEFSYTPDVYLTVRNWTTGASTTLTEYDIAHAASARQIPESLAYVQGLIGSGEAAAVDASSMDPTTFEFTIPIPARKLFVDTRVDPNAYGYTDLNLFRYGGASAGDLAGVASGDVTNVVATSGDGALTLYKGDAARSCFIAFQDSHSKSCPNNTAEGKRFTWVYARARLIDEYDGDVLLESVAGVDVNAAIVTSVKAVTKSGARTATIKRGKSVQLFCKTVPAKTIEKLTWKSLDRGIAKVSAKGKVTASGKRTGLVKIKVASSFGKTATFKLKVVK